MDLPHTNAHGAGRAGPGALQPAEQSVAILVLGMHRSGTSALSGTLSLLGVAVPGELQPPAADNEKGYFENVRIVQFHDRVLERFGSRWDDPLPLGEACFRSSAARAATQELAALLHEEFGDRPLVLAKDPRMCRLMPLWTDALSCLNRRIVALHPARHPLEVAASLQRRDSLSRAHALVLWLQHVLAAERATRGLPRCFTLYDELLRDWRSLVCRISDELGIAWPRERIRAGDEIDAFLTAELRHHRSAEDELAVQHDALQGLCARAWDALKALRTDAHDAGAQLALDEVTHAFDAALATLGPLVASHDRNLLQARGRAAEAEARLVEEARLRAAVEARLAEEAQVRAAVEARLAEETRLRAAAEAHLAEEARLRAAAERIAAENGQAAAESNQALAQALARVQAIEASTSWKVMTPIRHALERSPSGLRLAARRTAKLVWWTATGQVISRLRARRRPS